MENRKIVVVLGMHRAGTSFLANTLDAVGVNFGPNLLPASSANPDGYWEQAEIVTVHDNILRAIDRDWSGPKSNQGYPAQWWTFPEVQRFKGELIRIVQSELKQAPGVWGFKDPRTSRLLPLWEEIIKDLKLDPLFYLGVRNPGAVVESLKKRGDRLTEQHAEDLWFLHYSDILSRPIQIAATVDFDRWFEEPREQAKAIIRPLLNFISTKEDEAVERVLQRIKPGLRRNQGNRPCSDRVTKLYQTLLSKSVEQAVEPAAPPANRARRSKLAIITPHLGAVSETFITRHIRYLAPNQTVVVTQNIVDAKAAGNCPVLEIPFGLSQTKDAGKTFCQFLSEHQVTHVLCEYGCFAPSSW